MALAVKNLPMPETREAWVQSLDQEDPLEEGMALHSHILASETSWLEEPGGYSPEGHKESDLTEATSRAP